METLKSLFSGLVALVLVAAVGIGLYQAFRWTVGYLDALQPELVPILGAGVLGLLFLGWLLRWTRNRKNETHLRLRKAEVYHRFLTAWSRALQSPDADAGASYVEPIARPARSTARSDPRLEAPRRSR